MMDHEPIPRPRDEVPTGPYLDIPAENRRILIGMLTMAAVGLGGLASLIAWAVLR